MQLYVLKDDVIVPAKGEGAPFAGIECRNPLQEADRVMAGGARTVIYSGWFGDDEARPRRGIFPSDFRTWTPAGWAALDRFCDAVGPQLEAARASVCFRPHARHVLADPQACLSFLRRREGQPFEVLLDAAGFLTAGMLGRVEDHLTRAFEALAGQAGVPAVVLTNVERSGDELRAAPLTRGEIDAGVLVGLARRHAGELPWIVLEEDVEGQMLVMG